MGDIGFSYATAGDSWIKRHFIMFVERLSGQPHLKRLYLENQAHPRLGESFWQACVRLLELKPRYDMAALARIPKTGPVVVVANHPYGVLDGILISWLIEKVRSDFLVIVHSALLRAPEGRNNLLPVDFSESPEARATNIATRAAARERLDKGGVVIVFPAGMISTAPDRLGLRPAEEYPWQPFIAQLIQRSRATVVPIWFGGQNSQIFQIASHISNAFRLALVFHEVKIRIGSMVDIRVGEPIPYADLAEFKDRQAMVDGLRSRTLALEPPKSQEPPRGVRGKFDRRFRFARLPSDSGASERGGARR